MSWYDTKQSDVKVAVMLKLWGMQSTSSLPSLPSPLRPKMETTEKVLSMGQIELTAYLCLPELFKIKMSWNLTYVLIPDRSIWNGNVFVC